MSLLITEHERRDIDERFYHRVAVRSCIAAFALHENVSLYFLPRFSFSFVFRVRVIRELRRRGNHGIRQDLSSLSMSTRVQQFDRLFSDFLAQEPAFMLAPAARMKIFVMARFVKLRMC